MEITNLINNNQTSNLSSLNRSPRVDSREFLTLLTTQLRNQDPLQPSSNTEFLGQLAQLSQLEETQSQTATLQSIAAATRAGTSLQGLAQASSLIGKDITYFDESGVEKNGTVSKVSFESGDILLDIDGQGIPLGSVLSVAEH